AGIFDPTMGAVSAKSNLSLSTVYEIVKNYDGFIKVASVEGRGSAFRVYLPVIDKTGSKLPKNIFEQSIRGNERILFVDDEELLVHATKQLLTQQGFVVTAETSGLKALAKFQTNPKGFDLVITDQVMPGLSGKELIAAMLKIRPDLLTIVCSGSSAGLSEKEAMSLGIKGYCLKPLSLSELAQTIRKVLDDA
ncbi:MAG: response regulator, partial [Desulfuromonadales bacterium]|nr:response regulator [Desulfuromonadales bacterium]